MAQIARPKQTAQPDSSTGSARFKTRYVPPFSVQTQQKYATVIDGPLQGPPKLVASARGRRPTTPIARPTRMELDLEVGMTKFATAPQQKVAHGKLFRLYFDRGDLSIKMEYLCGGDRIAWTIDVDKLDYGLYLPLFFDGLAETCHPYKTYARQGVKDMLATGGEKILPILPQLILPLKNALNTRNLEVMCTTLKIIQQLITSSDAIGPAMVPFYRQLLPMFNAYKIRNVNCGDAIDYAQRMKMNIGDLIDETLQLMELHGGEDAFINIKYMVPTYESYFLN